MRNVHEMNRFDVLQELRGQAHPSWYRSLLEWRDEQLKALLVYYREGGEFPTQMMGRIHEGAPEFDGAGGAGGDGWMPMKEIHIGVDTARGPDQNVMIAVVSGPNGENHIFGIDDPDFMRACEALASIHGQALGNGRRN